MRSSGISKMNVFEFEMSGFESADTFPFCAPGIDNRSSFHESVDIDR